MRRLLKYIITLYYRLINIGKSKISPSAVILRGCLFEGHNSVGNYTYLSRTSMGYGSFVGFGCEFSNCIIGKFCSIGSNIRVVSATHPVKDFVSTHPAFFSDSYWFHYVKQSRFREHLANEDGSECLIGNDVWIGDNVLIMGGIKIGDGSIIGMGSIVLHDVPPYTIIAGVPAKEIRKRFSKETINALLRLGWWNKPIDWIEANADDFSDAEHFVSKYAND